MSRMIQSEIIAYFPASMLMAFLPCGWVKGIFAVLELVSDIKEVGCFFFNFTENEITVNL